MAKKQKKKNSNRWFISVRMIDGEKYAYRGYKKKKTEAKTLAKSLGNNFNTRVIPGFDGYAVYYKPKKNNKKRKR